MKKRDIFAVVLLCLFTCGIYPLYWYYATTEEANIVDSDEKLTNFILAFLLGIVTCGIYLLYWEYLFYKKIDKITGRNDAILHLVLSIFLTPIISLILVQNNINSSDN